MIKTDKDGNIIGRKEFEDNNEKVKLALAEKAREVMLEKNFKSIQQARTHMQKLGIDQQVKTDVVGADKRHAR
jgi:sulfur relay (sulfurtransferase) DsrC/TusE family protein